MLRVVAVSLVLTFASYALANGEVELRLTADSTGTPTAAPNTGGTWNGGESLIVELWLRTTQDLSVRYMQVDPRASSPQLVLGQDIDNLNLSLDAVPNFWFDYSDAGGQYPITPNSPCLSCTPSSGEYIDFSNLNAGPSMTPIAPSAVSLASPSGTQKTFQQGIFGRLGGIPVTLPTQPGTYTLDLLNLPQTDNVNDGLTIGFGFGVAANDPYTIWSSASADSKADGSIEYSSQSGPVTFVVVPEPTTLILLGLGALVLFRKRRAASRDESASQSYNPKV